MTFGSNLTKKNIFYIFDFFKKRKNKKKQIQSFKEAFGRFTHHQEQRIISRIKKKKISAESQDIHNSI